MEEKRLRKNWQEEQKNADCPSRTIYAIAIPIMLSSASGLLLNLIDTVMVGQYSATALAAVGISGAVFGLLTISCSAAGVGINALIAQSIGAGKVKIAGKLARSGLLLGLFFGMIVTGIIRIFSVPLLNYLGAEDELFDMALVYLKIVQYLFVWTFVGSMLKNIFNANSYTRPIFLMTLITSMTNIVADYFLIYGKFGFPRMGVAGAAWATIFSSIVGFVYIFAIAIKKRKILHLDYSVGFLEMFSFFPKILKMGLPTMIEWGVWSAAMFFVNKFIINYEPLQVAVFHTGMKIQAIFMLCVSGFSAASITLIGKAFGARDAARLFAWNRKMLQHTILILMLGTFSCIFFPYQILRIFFNASDMSKINNIGLTFSLIGIIILFRGVNIVVGSALRGIGDISYFFKVQPLGLFITVSLSWLLLIHFEIGIIGYFIAMLVDEVTRGGLVIWRFRYKSWHLFKDFNMHNEVDYENI